MSGKYTCQRCISHLKKPSARRSIRNGEALPFSARWSSSSRQPAILPDAPSKAIKRALSSTPTRFNHAAASVASVPPGYQYSLDAEEARSRLILQSGNLYHPLSSSPSPAIRRRAAFIKKHAYCPHPSHAQTRTSTSPLAAEARQQTTGALAPAHAKFECPDCGTPLYCCEEHWQDDYEAHLEICDTLRTINEDDHDLRSGRLFNEFEYPGPQMDEILVNMTSWDTLLFTREFEAINDERALRQATKVLTYPMTVGSILHELSPYHVRKGGRLTAEGLKSFSGTLFSICIYLLSR